MSIKKLFQSTEKNRNYLSDTTQQEAFKSIESADNLEQINELQQTYIPGINYKNPASFAKFGSAYLYYKSSLERILEFYPYDGSDAEKNAYHNKSLPIDKYIYDNLYPRTTGYIQTCAEGWGDQSSISGGYGVPATNEYVTFFGGPGTGSFASGSNVTGMLPDESTSQFQYSNIYDTNIYTNAGLPSDYASGSRESNLKSDFDTGVTVEFWLQTGSLNAPDDNASAVNAIDTTGVVADGGDCTIRITIPPANGGDTTGGVGGITILLDASETTGTPPAADQIGIGTNGESDSSIATLIKRAINNTSNSRIIPASAGSRGTAGVTGISAAVGSSDTQVTLTMDEAGAIGNVARAVLNDTGPAIVDVTNFTGGDGLPGCSLLYLTQSVYDNWYIHRPIPASQQQYRWISSSMENMPTSPGVPVTLFGYSELSGGYFVKSLPLVSQSVVLSAENTGDFRSCGYTALQAANLGFDKVIPVDFVGLSTIVLDPVSASLNQLGFSSLEIDPILVFGSFTLSDSNYINMTFVDLGLYTAPTVPAGGGHNWSAGRATILNSILLNRNGPYGWPSWKQIRTGEHPVSRNHRKNCILSVRVKTGTDINLGARKGNAITHFTEPQVYSSEFPLTHKFTLKIPPQTGPGPHFVINPDLGRRTLKSSYGNKLINFANYEANNILNVRHNYDSGDLYFNRINSMIMEGKNNDPAFAQLLSKIGASYAQTVYPAAYNAFLERTRARKYYSITNIWDNRRATRSSYSPTAAALTNSQGMAIPVGSTTSMLQKPSVWPLDAHTSTFVGAGLGPGFSGSVSWAYDDGAGELQNSYSRFFVKQHFDPSKGTDDVIIYPAATYNARVLLGTVYGRTPADSTTIVSCSAIVGDRFNLVAGTFEALNHNAGSGKYPYKTYPEYAKYLRLIGKDYSIVPEFRISEHMEDYLQNEDYITLGGIDDLLDLTGSREEDIEKGLKTRSARPGFFKEYGNSDFMKMFDVVNGEYDGASLVDGSKMSQDKIGLRCNALLQFLPYKGFYPAERTLELASLFSQSFGDNIIKSGSGVAHPAVYRAILEPLYSPGIMFNTIKSGIAVSNFVISNTCSDLVAPPVITCGHMGPVGNSISASMVINRATSSLPEGNLHFMHMLPPFKTFSNTPNGEYSSSYWEENGYFFQKVPFEALYSPRNYLSSHFISGSGRIYDTGLGSSSLEEYATYMGDTSAQNYVTWNGEGDSRYELAIDNFLCETVNFFENGLTSIVSDREENFGAAKSGSAYTMTMKLYRPTIPNPGYAWGDEHDNALNDYTKTTIPDFDKFDMYRRISAFGPPLASKTWAGISPYPGSIAGEFPGAPAGINGNHGPAFSASFSHLTPPYYAGSGSCTFTFTATYDGAPTLDEIFANMEVSFERMEIVPLHIGGPGTYKQAYPLKVMMKDSFNLTASISSVPEGSGELKNQWLIQSKFETPIINIAGDRGGNSRDAFYGLLPESVPSASHIPPGDPPTSGHSTQTSNQDLRCWGLWHDYGSIPSGSDEGVFAIIDSPSPKEGNSLAELVGMPIGKPVRIGEIKRSNLLEEAVVAIPFFVGKDGRRKFYRLDKKSKNSIKQVSKHLLKYVFPPRFDFNINRDMDPVAMYVFEFGMEVSQQDIADMWQNLPPSINERFAQKVSVIEHKLLKDQMINKTNRKLRSDLRWLVFKVKKRAESDYSRFTKKGLVNNLNVIPSNIENSRYSYNWPYDYFSLVELVKIDEVIEYASELPPDSRVEIVGEVSLTPPAPTEVRRELMGVQSHGIELWRVHMSDGTTYTDRVNPEFE